MKVSWVIGGLSVVAFAIIVMVVVTMIPSTQAWMAADACVEAGGAWDYAKETCKRA